jgi:flagella basal body P-ring formation protein FlgA
MNKLNKLILAAILALSAQAIQATNFQSHESIKTASIDYLASKIQYKDFKITISELDKRLKLPNCNQPLEVFTHRNKIKLGRLSVGVRCIGEPSWTIYNRASINAFKNVIVLNQPVKRGEIITRNHLLLQHEAIAGIKQDFFTNPELAINQQATRNLAVGTILRKKHLTLPKLVKRGQKITISAHSPVIDIQMTGLALMDGTKGQRIRVKNEQSKRIIEATVINPGLVLVDF